MPASVYTGSIVSFDGFYQQVPNPANPASTVQAMRHSALYAARTALAPAVTSYAVYIPKTAAIESILVAVTTAFNGTTPVVSVGTTVGGHDLLDSFAIDVPGAATVAVPPSVTPQVIYITLTGGSTVGDGLVSVRYTN